MMKRPRLLLRVGLPVMLFAAVICPSPVQARALRVHPLSIGAQTGADWSRAYRTISAALAAAASGDELWVAGVPNHRFHERVTMKSGVALFGGFAGTETARDQRDWKANRTEITHDEGSVVTVPAGTGSGTLLDGFLIRGGGPDFAVQCLNDSSISLYHNTVNGPTGAIRAGSGSRPIIVANVIAASGYGLYADHCIAVIVNNTIASNSAVGITCSSGAGYIANNVVALNGLGITYIQDLIGQAPTLLNNCLFNPGAADYAGVTPGVGDISADPRLASVPTGDLHLLAGSPCIDAGLDTAQQAATADIDGHVRPQGLRVDIGADEYDGAQPAEPQRRTVYVSTSGANDLTHDGSSWQLAKRTIQAGVTVAQSWGGEVWVAAGTYAEHVTLQPYVSIYGGFAGNETSFGSRDWRRNKTVIDGAGSGDVVQSAGGNLLTVVDGFHITNGGCGIKCLLSSVTVSNCTLTGNIGSAIEATGSSRILNNRIIANGKGVTLSGYQGSATIADNEIGLSKYTGILCGSQTSGVITGNWLYGNGTYDVFSPLSYSGIECEQGARVEVASNRVIGFATGISANRSSQKIVNNVISECSTTGIYTAPISTSLIANNTITGCGNGILFQAYSPFGLGGPDKADQPGGTEPVKSQSETSSGPTIANNIFAFNRIGIAGSSSTAVLNRNCMYNPGGTNYATVAPGSDDFAEDPGFVSGAYGNLHLQPGSPCIDAGVQTVVEPGWNDVDGQARVLGASVDVGADESDGTLWPEQLPRIVRVSPSGADDDAHDGSSWERAKRSLQAGIVAASADGGEVWVKSGTYLETVALLPYCHVYGGFAGDESAREQRDWQANVTVLDGGGVGHVVSIGGANTMSVNTLDGLTICNSESGAGNGINCAGPSTPLLEHLIVTGNRTGINTAGIVRNSLIAGNSVGLGSLSPGATFINNTVAGNYTGISTGSSLATVKSNIIAFNGKYGVQGNTKYPGVMASNCVYNPGARDYYNATPGSTDIQVDPGFRSYSYGRLQLQPTSPCVDAGTVLALDPGTADVDGQSRVKGHGVDIGACESDGTLWPEYAPPAIRVDSDTGVDDSAHDGSSWDLAKKTVQAGIRQAATIGAEVWVASGTYGERIRMLPFAYVYGGFAGTETNRNERDTAANCTTIDGGGLGHVVSALGGTWCNALDGLTIVNSGSQQVSSPSAGVYCFGYLGWIRGNTIRANNAGVRCESSAPEIVGNRFESNTTGILGNNSYYPVVEGNSFSGNVVGIDCSASGPHIRANTFLGPMNAGIKLSLSSGSVENNRVSGATNVGITCSTTTAPIRNNIVSGNTSIGMSLSGLRTPVIGNVITNNGSHGLSLSSCDGAVIGNNTISGNATTGLLSQGSGSPRLLNNIIALSPKGIYKLGSGSPVLSSNCVYNPQGTNYTGVAAGTGDISLDPLLADASSGDVHINAASPCRDRASLDAYSVEAYDMDGEGRVSGGKLDIGADEFWPGELALSDLKAAPDGAAVTGSGPVVSATFVDDFYIQSDSRACGLRVHLSDHTLAVGQRVSLAGRMFTGSNGERCLLAESATPYGTGTVRPMLVRNIYLGGSAGPKVWQSGGSQKGIYGSLGLNNIGLLMSTSGVVTAPRTPSGWFYVDDGSGTWDGSSIRGVYIDATSLVAPEDGSFATVTGISSCEWYEGRLVNVMRPRFQTDIVVAD